MSLVAAETAEAQWLAQVAAMRAALVDLKLPLRPVDDLPDTQYDDYFDFDEEISSGFSGDDVWDFVSSVEEEEYNSDLINDTETFPLDENTRYGPEWLMKRSTLLAESKQGLSADELQGQILALLASDSGQEELQSTLTDIVGFDDLDFIIELISHRTELVPPPPPISGPRNEAFNRLQTRQQREEALRRQDYEHKHASLGPSLDRDGPHYPHVYRAHSSGNTLSAGGRKYALPQGSERKEHEESLKN